MLDFLIHTTLYYKHQGSGMVPCKAHNLEIVGSIPTPGIGRNAISILLKIKVVTRVTPEFFMQKILPPRSG